MLFENVSEAYAIIINFGCIIFLIICSHIRHTHLVKGKSKNIAFIKHYHKGCSSSLIALNQGI